MVSTKQLVPLNALIATSDPSTPTARTGDIYYHSSNNELRYYDGATWVALPTLNTAQTFTNTKTFSGAATVFHNTGGNYQLRLQQQSNSTFLIDRNGANWGGILINGGSAPLGGTTTPHLAVRNHSGGTSNLQEWQSSTPTVLASINSAGLVTTPAVAASGLTGATTATRYVGGTASAAPASGTFLTGDFVVAQSGTLYICTAGGSPGTWVQVASASQITYGTTGDLADVTKSAEAAGSSSAVARADHKHDISSAAPGALSGSTQAEGTATSLARSDHQHGIPTVLATQAFSATGLTGATAGGRFVGAVASPGAPPSSGTFSVGDFVVSQMGRILICVTGGSPGTWVDAASAASNIVTTDGAQSISGAKTFTGGVIVNTVGITGNQTIALTGTGASSVGGTFASTAYAPSGLTGATTATRYVGGTASGAPASGTFVTGDFVVTQSGTIYVCTAGGTPGTWIQLAASPVGDIETFTFSYTGTLADTVGTSRLYLDASYALESVRVGVDTAPSGGTEIIDINRSGTTIYGTQSARPTIAAAANTAVGGSATVTTFSAGDYLTVDIDADGTATGRAANLTVTVRLRRTG